jgi:hypothetical protein
VCVCVRARARVMTWLEAAAMVVRVRASCCGDEVAGIQIARQKKGWLGNAHWRARTAEELRAQRWTHSDMHLSYHQWARADLAIHEAAQTQRLRTQTQTQTHSLTKLR